MIYVTAVDGGSEQPGGFVSSTDSWLEDVPTTTAAPSSSVTPKPNVTAATNQTSSGGGVSDSKTMMLLPKPPAFESVNRDDSVPAGERKAGKMQFQPKLGDFATNPPCPDHEVASFAGRWR